MNTIVVTGATSGIGLETARILIMQGYRVIGIGHSQKNCKHAKESIVSENANANVTYLLADLMQEREVLRISDEIADILKQSSNGELYALINNVGCVRSWYTTTDEGYEQQLALNHLAGFLLTYRLLPYLKKAKGRVLITGSDSHKGIEIHWADMMLTRGYNPIIAYKQSKLCNMLFAQGLNDRFATSGIHAYVIDPGLVKTDIVNKQTGTLVKFIWGLRKRHGIAPCVPAKTFAYLCDQGNDIKGLYYYRCKEKPYSKQVTSENANHLFAISERLCAIHYDKEVLV